VPLPHPADGPPPRSGEDLADLAEQAARLCKADLVTEMVGEFPELQGLMGGYYARAEDLPEAVADAIRDHYKPVGQGDEVPTAPVTVAVSLADKLDTIACFFVIGEKPTGSKDPFALRRAALGVLSLILTSSLRHSVGDMLTTARRTAIDQGIADSRSRPEPYSIDDEFDKIVMADLNVFIQDRLKVQQREAGIRHDLIDAVFALGGEDDLVRLLARVHALQAFVATPDGTNLLAGYKRAANILKKEGYPTPNDRLPGLDPGSRLDASAAQDGSGTPGQARGDEVLAYTPEPAEKALIQALAEAAPKAAAAVAEEQFAEAMAALATLRAPIDAFFDSVTVNDADEQKRSARLSLLSRFRDAVHSVADFSKIEG
jgi:glycyl-tRNA synthetase beta chain